MSETKDFSLSRNAKDVRITRMMLSTKVGKLSLLNVFRTLQIYESIFENNLSGSISIIDSNNIQSMTHLEGGEKLEIEFMASGRSEKKTLEFYVYKISEKVVDTDAKLSYVIYFCSKELIINSMKKVSRLYSDNTGEIVKDLMTNVQYGLETTKKIDLEESSSTISFIPALWTPLKSINFLSYRAVSKKYVGSPYLLFETLNNYVFSSISNLFEKPVKKEYTFAPKLTSFSTNPEEDSTLVEQYTIGETNDIFKKISEGFFGSKLKTFDLLTKKYREIDYSSFDEKNNSTIKYRLNQFPYANKNPVFSNTNLSTNFEQKQKFIVQHTYEFETVEKAIPFDANYTADQTYNQRDAQLTEMESQVIKMHVAGDSEISSGDTVYFKVFKGNKDSKKQELDEFLSGKYLVTSIAHRIVENKYEMQMIICKDSLIKPYMDNLK